jgi:Tfp pilus assembly protein PilF
MIQQWFAALNDTLDDLIRRYPEASPEQKNELEQQWNVLKALSDDIIELWLQFEDKMSVYRDLKHGASASPGPSKLDNHPMWQPYTKGQGYFQLQMFREGAHHFEETLTLEPEFHVARLFLAMCRMHLGEFEDAQRHFQWIAAVTEEPKLQAIAFNALGCVQAVYANLNQAQSYFRKAVEADPSFEDPRRNLESCRNRSGQLRLQFGTLEMQTLVKA